VARAGGRTSGAGAQSRRVQRTFRHRHCRGLDSQEPRAGFRSRSRFVRPACPSGHGSRSARSARSAPNGSADDSPAPLRRPGPDHRRSQRTSRLILRWLLSSDPTLGSNGGANRRCKLVHVGFRLSTRSRRTRRGSLVSSSRRVVSRPAARWRCAGSGPAGSGTRGARAAGQLSCDARRFGIKIDGVLDEDAWKTAAVVPLPFEWAPGDNTPRRSRPSAS